jgi:hypothetical protein
MITEEEFKKLEGELLPYKIMMGKAGDVVMDQEVSNYPIFVVHQDEINVGIPLDTSQVYGKWQVNVSSLEEFATKQLVDPSKIDEFRKVYKDPKDHLCLFLVWEGAATFIFIPR